MDILEFIATLFVGLLGGFGLERYRDARKDHEHRQFYYHEYLKAADAAADALTQASDGDSLAGGPIPDVSGESDESFLERLRNGLDEPRQGIEVFGHRAVVAACRSYEASFDAAQRETLVAAMRRDVAPRRFGFWRRG
jgi:hypothetical protein